MHVITVPPEGRMLRLLHRSSIPNVIGPVMIVQSVPMIVVGLGMATLGWLASRPLFYPTQGAGFFFGGGLLLTLGGIVTLVAGIALARQDTSPRVDENATVHRAIRGRASLSLGAAITTSSCLVTLAARF